MKKYKVITVNINSTGQFDLSEINKFLDDGWQIQEVRMTSGGSSTYFGAWQTFVLYQTIAGKLKP